MAVRKRLLGQKMLTGMVGVMLAVTLTALALHVHQFVKVPKKHNAGIGVIENKNKVVVESKANDDVMGMAMFGGYEWGTNYSRYGSKPATFRNLNLHFSGLDPFLNNRMLALHGLRKKMEAMVSGAGHGNHGGHYESVHLKIAKNLQASKDLLRTLESHRDRFQRMIGDCMAIQRTLEENRRGADMVSVKGNRSGNTEGEGAWSSERDGGRENQFVAEVREESDRVPLSPDEFAAGRSGQINDVNNSSSVDDDALIIELIASWKKLYTCVGSGSCSSFSEITARSTQMEADGGYGDQASRHFSSQSEQASADVIDTHASLPLQEEEKQRLQKLLEVLPPHLTDCDADRTRHMELDQRRSNGRLPYWALDEAVASSMSSQRKEDGSVDDETGGADGQEEGPFPPWIHGADSDNLPLTRVVQRDLWVLQHPVDCEAPHVRFAIGEWWGLDGHGIGSQLHCMTAIFGAAVRSGRVFVPFDNYLRAGQDNCAPGVRQRLDCYFEQTTPETCFKRAMMLLEAARREGGNYTATNKKEMDEMMGNDSLSVVFLPAEAATWYQRVTPVRWGKPWKPMAPTIVMQGKMVDEGKMKKVSWWRAQALRYLLRSPSRYLCCLVNRERNRSFGEVVAREMVASSRRLDDRLLYSSSTRRRGVTQAEWTESNVDRLRQDTQAEVMGSLSTTRYSMKDRQLFLPRPIISIHVRLGRDKRTEMDLFRFPAYMRIAEAIRQRSDPGLSHVWLSTDVRSVVNSSAEFSAWRFFYSDQQRIEENQKDWALEMKGGSRYNATDAVPCYSLVEKSFVNLLISSEADYFIGALASNWCRLIDEMRRTNGRIHKNYITMSYRPW